METRQKVSRQEPRFHQQSSQFISKTEQKSWPKSSSPRNECSCASVYRTRDQSILGGSKLILRRRLRQTNFSCRSQIALKWIWPQKMNNNCIVLRFLFCTPASLRVRSRRHCAVSSPFSLWCSRNLVKQRHEPWGFWFVCRVLPSRKEFSLFCLANEIVCMRSCVRHDVMFNRKLRNDVRAFHENF